MESHSKLDLCTEADIKVHFALSKLGLVKHVLLKVKKVSIQTVLKLQKNDVCMFFLFFFAIYGFHALMQPALKTGNRKVDYIDKALKSSSF